MSSTMGNLSLRDVKKGDQLSSLMNRKKWISNSYIGEAIGENM